MPLKAILIDREKLVAHRNWNAPLQQLLRELYKYQVAVINISEPLVTLEELGITYEDCLMIADCEETLQQAKQWNCAVLGYESPVQEDVNSIPLQEQQDGKADQESMLSLPIRRIQSTLEMLVEGFEEIDFYFLERMYQRFHHLPWTVIETERCYLREITLDDIDRLYELYAPGEITKYMDGLHENREEEVEYTKAYIDHMYRFYGYGLWLVVEKATGEIIGRAGLEHRETQDEWWLEMGYMIGVDYQKKGYATEVCQGVLQYAREALEFEEISCMIQKENTPSIHLAEKLGFHWEKRVLLQGKEMEKYTKKL